MHPPTRWSRSALAVLLAALAVLAAACGSSGSSDSSSGEGLRLATSIPPFQDLVARVAGDRAEVTSVVPAGVDGHTYEPTPGGVRVLAQVDALFVPDIQLNPVVTDLASQNMPDDAQIIDLNALVIPDDEVVYSDSHSHGAGPSHGHQRNVHTWTNMPYVAAWSTRSSPHSATSTPTAPTRTTRTGPSCAARSTR